MLNFHTCKITSEKETKIEHDVNYQKCVQQMSAACGAMDINKIYEMIMGDELRLQNRCYKDCFELPLSRNLIGLYTIPVVVNNQKCNFILDTGAQISGMNGDLVKKMGIPKTKGKMSVGSVGGKEKAMQGICVQNFRIGALEYFQLPMIILDSGLFKLPILNVPMLSFDGIIGWDILSQLDFEFDDIGKQFKVCKNNFKFNYCNMVKGLFPTFLLKDDHQQLRMFGFDSGAKCSWINPNIIDEHQLKVVRESKAIGFGVHGMEELKLKIIDGCVYHLFKAKIELRNVGTGRCNIYQGFEFDGILGNEIFHNRRIRILNSCGMVLLT
ncbi:MAG: retropepsin-like aspartic protease [Erysipelotrichaceae bacterium]